MFIDLCLIVCFIPLVNIPSLFYFTAPFPAFSLDQLRACELVRLVINILGFQCFHVKAWSF